MPAKKQKNYRLPAITIKKIAGLVQNTGMTEVQVIIMAIDHLTEEEAKKRQQAQEHGQ